MSRRLLFSLLYLLASSIAKPQEIISLAGPWQVFLGENRDAKYDHLDWDRKEGTILLPSSLSEQGFGLKTEGSDYGVLTPTHRFIGTAFYRREIVIPEAWEEKDLTLFLERVMWESKVLVDGKELTVQDALGTPHIHRLGTLEKGVHSLEVQVNNDMIHNIGDKGHAYGDYTQGIWNGIVGRIELQAREPVHFSKLRTFSYVEKDALKIEVEMEADMAQKAEVHFTIRELDGTDIMEKSMVFDLAQGRNRQETILNLDQKLKKWTEFDPRVYVVQASMKTSNSEDRLETEFGFSNVSHNGTKILINNRPIFLRGNLDCVHFPLTGYPSTDIEDWMEIFKIYKAHGLNHVRFHSWCPPEAAFKAANRTGIYIQAEASIWIDWWMSEDMKVRGRPEMDTKGYPKGLGFNAPRDSFVVLEMNRVVDFYGNHPSFIMFCIGNELGNSDFDVMAKWISDLKNVDPRRLYSVSTARKITEVDDYMVTHYIPEVGRTRGLNGAGTDWDFEEVYSTMDIPTIAHEIGQWPVYPTWSEIEKYHGVLRARNFEALKTLAEENGIADQDEAFRRASGALNQLLYKYETESFLRTPSCAGVQLLSMQDYQGQGEALIGWLDAHWDSKGVTAPEKFREHFDETVPLLRTEKFVWTTDQVFTGKVQLSHHGHTALGEGLVQCHIRNDRGEVVFEEAWEIPQVTVGSLIDVGTIEYPLTKVRKAEKLQIAIQVTDTRFKNEWNIWAYPPVSAISVDDMVTTNEWNDTVFKILQQGGKVLLDAHLLGTDANSIAFNFYPLYWSLTFFPGQGKTSLGLLLDAGHKAFKHFPSDNHIDWQWESICKNSRAFILNSMPAGYKPLVQVVDDFHRNNKEGLIFEFKVGAGKLLVSGFDLDGQSFPVAQQLKHSLIAYMKSEDFDPVYEVDGQFLHQLFPRIPAADNASLNETEGRTLLEVNAGGLAQEGKISQPWIRDLDQMVHLAEDVSYKVQAEGVYKKDDLSAWWGNRMIVDIDCPPGFLGSFYVLFNDGETKEREGILQFEGRKVKLGPRSVKTGEWVKFHVMREDSNDGKLQLKVESTSGDDIMIARLRLNQEE